MKSSYITKIISSNFIQKRFSNLSYLPRWIVVCIDFFILLVASFLTFFIVSNLTNKFNEAYSVEFRYGLIICVNLIFFFIFRTYAGIIRFTTFVDAIRILVATFLSFVTLVIINFTSYALYGSEIYLLPTLIIYFITSFVLLFLFRVAIKFIFDNYLSKSKEKNLQKVVILGTSQNAVALANSLNIQSPQKYKLVGFIDISKAKNHNKDLLGIPIFKIKNSMPPLLRVLKAEAIILLNEDISNEEKLKIVEECLRFDYKILTVPELNDWSNKKYISKRIKKFEIKDLLERLPIELDNKNIEIQIKNKVLLVTGAAGSIGSEIVTQVLKYKPAKLILVDQAETPLHNIVLELAKKTSDTKIISLIADIRDELLLHHIFTTYKPNVVYHAAAYKHVPLMEENPYQAIMTNVKGTKCLADLALQHKVERFVMVSTDKAVNPSNIMGASKRIAEIYVQSLFFKGNASNESTTKFITTRFGNVLGSNGSVVPLFTKQIEEGGPITITHPDIIRYFMTIPEACQLVLEAGAMGNGGEIYIFDMGKPVKIIDLARKMIQLAGYVPEVEIPIKIVGLRPGEKLYEELLNDSAKTLPTHHQKIMIATEQSNYGNKELQDLLEELLETSKQFKINEAVGIMKRIVPEFVSKNSEFEILDN